MREPWAKRYQYGLWSKRALIQTIQQTGFYQESKFSEMDGYQRIGGKARHLGDALIDGLLVDDVDELLPRLVRGRAPLRGLR